MASAGEFDTKPKSIAAILMDAAAVDAAALEAAQEEEESDDNQGVEDSEEEEGENVENAPLKKVGGIKLLMNAPGVVVAVVAAVILTFVWTRRHAIMNFGNAILNSPVWTVIVYIITVLASLLLVETGLNANVFFNVPLNFLKKHLSRCIVFVRTHLQPGYKVHNSKCEYCQQTANVTDMKRCARCKSEYYCNKECQKAAWKDHKLVCKDENGLTMAEMAAKIKNLSGGGGHGHGAGAADALDCQIQ